MVSSVHVFILKMDRRSVKFLILIIELCLQKTTSLDESFENKAALLEEKASDYSAASSGQSSTMLVQEQSTKQNYNFKHKV